MTVTDQTVAVQPTMQPASHSASSAFDVWRRVAPIVGILLFAAALWVLDRELHAMTFRELSESVSRVSVAAILSALLLTIVNYAVLTGYDQLAFVYIGRRLGRWQIAMASFVGYAIANNLGFAIVSGASARYRFYSRWGLDAHELSRIVLFYAGTFWLGLLVLGGFSLVVKPPAGVEGLGGAAWVRAIGGLLLLIGAAYGVVAFALRRPVRLGRFEVTLPAPPLVAAQYVLSCLDWALAVAVLYTLLPPPRPAFWQVVAAFLGAQILALGSHVPGGLGVFESLMVLFLKPALTAGTLLPALLAFRVVYYLVPLVFALVILLVDEFYQRRRHVMRWGNAFGGLAVTLTPKVLAVLTFVGGVVLLFSGTTPAATGRLAWLSRVLPPPVLEISHFAGSLVGIGLLFISRGIARRIDAAYYLAAAGLAIGAAASMLKGFDYEEASVLVLLLVLLIFSRREFDRKAALFDAPLSVSWFGAVAAVVGASVWLGFFAFRHVEYSNDLFWRFEVLQEASRALRASVAVTVVTLMVGLLRLLRPAPPALRLPLDDEMIDVDRVIATQGSTSPYLAYLRDKALLWNENRTAFLMYGVQGRSWVSLGDPVGPPAVARPLVREFLERCDDFDAIPVFYEVGSDSLHVYADFGLTFLKLGEEGRVPLDRFSLEGGEHKGLRAAVRRIEKEGAQFRIVPAEQVSPLLPVLGEISDEWLGERRTAEKGFSLGFFREDYVARFPVGIIERDNRIEAFANLWPGPGKVELSVDLMRHRGTAPKGVMDALFAHLMLWGRDQGYRWFSLGMAPLSGIDASEIAPRWAKIAAFVYRQGEAFYNFQGLRAYKEKFHPVWEPRYLAYPGGLATPRVIADVTALIAGGYRGIFGRSNRTEERRVA